MLSKQEFAQRYAQAAGDATSVREAARQIDRVFEVLAQVVHETGSHRIPGFGIWEIRQRAARNGKNPLNGEPIKIKASKSLVFRPAQALRQRVQKAPRKTRSKAA